MNPPVWEDTLLNYLASSNEDDCVVDFFEKHILDTCKQFSSLNWLEVGPGPGTKTIRIMDLLSSIEFPRLDKAVACEPSARWRAHIRKALVSYHSSYQPMLQIRSCSFRTILKEYAARRTALLPNLITLIHVMYDHDVLQQLSEYMTLCLRRAHSPLLLLIVVESEESDLYKLRRVLSKEAFRVPFSDPSSIRNMLTTLQVQFEEQMIKGETCPTHVALRSDWFLPFLLGVGYNDSQLHQRSGKLASIVNTYLCTLPSSALDLSDVAFIVDWR